MLKAHRAENKGKG